MRRIALALITAYQRYLSPYKGFSCAYRRHTGRASCSTLGYRVIRRHGVLKGLSLLLRRTAKCGVAHRRHQYTSVRRLSSQQGVCDLACDLPCHGSCDLPCDGGFHFPNLHGLSSACDYVSCCDCGSCDWPSRKRKNREEEKYVYIPPRQQRSR